ncbi:MAG: hypothetical protein C5B50_02115 [Verrucomicrobia bacterium]|nr:MAG: hypothetical protein C5B50_02115 [Verrucomicrobiota bacterium]
MTDNSTFGFALLLPAAVTAVGYVTWCFLRSRSLLKRWANEHGFEVLDAKLSPSGPPSWIWTGSRSQTVYLVRVREINGRERRGWVRCGSFWLGVISGWTDVEWEDKLPAAQ